MRIDAYGTLYNKIAPEFFQVNDINTIKITKQPTVFHFTVLLMECIAKFFSRFQNRKGQIIHQLVFLLKYFTFELL